MQAITVNFRTDKGSSKVWIPEDLILQVVRNSGLYTDETGESKSIDFLSITLKEKMQIPKTPGKAATKLENIVYTITDPAEIESVLSQL